MYVRQKKHIVKGKNETKRNETKRNETNTRRNAKHTCDETKGNTQRNAAYEPSKQSLFLTAESNTLARDRHTKVLDPVCRCYSFVALCASFSQPWSNLDV